MRKLLRVRQLAVVVSTVAVGLFTLAGVQSITRGTPVSAVKVVSDHGGLPPVTDSLFSRSMELYTGLHLTKGNGVEQVNNGAVYPRLWKDLRAAEHTITVQMYYSLPGAVADTMAAILRERARAGIRVLFVLDAFGSFSMKHAWIDSLRAAGVEVGILRPLRWHSLRTATERSHVRVVVVDGEVGYTGGFGLADYWLGDGRHDGQWRDSNVRFEGPSVMSLQAAFASAWAECTGELLAGDTFFPKKAFETVDGGVEAAIFFASPTTGSTAAERFVALSIVSARRTLYVTNSYFVPDDDFRRFLTDARARGVDVRILTASGNSDVKSTWRAGRYRYEDLLARGIRIYEYQPTMMHAKTFVVDGMWGSIGSMNFDNRSLAFNNESNFVFLDARQGARMNATFLEDQSYSREITLGEFTKRPWFDHVLELGAALLSRVL